LEITSGPIQVNQPQYSSSKSCAGKSKEKYRALVGNVKRECALTEKERLIQKDETIHAISHSDIFLIERSKLNGIQCSIQQQPHPSTPSPSFTVQHNIASEECFTTRTFIAQASRQNCGQNFYPNHNMYTMHEVLIQLLLKFSDIIVFLLKWRQSEGSAHLWEVYCFCLGMFWIAPDRQTDKQTADLSKKTRCLVFNLILPVAIAAVSSGTGFPCEHYTGLCIWFTFIHIFLNSLCSHCLYSKR